jgi:hypothetical protein
MSQTLPAPMPDLLLVEGPVPTLAWPWCILPPIHLQRPAAVLEAPMPSARRFPPPRGDPVPSPYGFGSIYKAIHCGSHVIL